MGRVSEFRQKEVINVHDGRRYGYVVDVEIDLEKGVLDAIVVPGNPRLLGLFGRQPDCIIPWSHIKRIGEDIILDNSYLEKQIPQLLEEIIGARFGYTYIGKIKDYNLRMICECQDEIYDAALDYQKTLESKNKDLKTILSKKPFKISSDINYYWVPVSALP